MSRYRQWRVEYPILTATISEIWLQRAELNCFWNVNMTKSDPLLSVKLETRPKKIIIEIVVHYMDRLYGNSLRNVKIITLENKSYINIFCKINELFTDNKWDRIQQAFSFLFPVLKNFLQIPLPPSPNTIYSCISTHNTVDRWPLPCWPVFIWRRSEQ